MEQLVEALACKPEGRGFDFRLYHSSDSTMALGSTHLLREIVLRIFLGGKAVVAVIIIIIIVIIIVVIVTESYHHPYYDHHVHYHIIDVAKTVCRSYPGWVVLYRIFQTLMAYKLSRSTNREDQMTCEKFYPTNRHR